jgi:hypothetical protein
VVDVGDDAEVADVVELQRIGAVWETPARRKSV